MQQYSDSILDNDGNAIAGARVLVLNEASSPATIYNVSTGAATGNPITTGKLGDFAFAAPNGRYRLQVSVDSKVYRTVGPVLLYDPADDADRLPFSVLTGASGSDNIGYSRFGLNNFRWTVQDKLRELPVSPLDLGATQASADISPFAQAALDGLMMTGGTVVIPAGTWKIKSTLTQYPNTRLMLEDGADIDISGLPTTAAFIAGSGTRGTAYPLASGVTKGGTSATMSTANLTAAGIAAGDWVRLASNAVFDPQRTSSKIGELIRVDAVDSGTGVITFRTPLADSYAVEDSATITRVVLAKGIQITGNGTIRGGAVGTSHKGIMLTLCDSPFIGDGLRFTSVNDRGIYLIDCVRPRVHNVSFRDALHAATGYGISITDATCDGIYTMITAENVRHLLTTNNTSATGGIPRRHILSGWVAKQSAKATGGTGGDSVDTHAAAEDIHIWNGESHAASGCGANMECRSGSLSHIWIYNPASHGANVHNETARPGDWVVHQVHVRNGAADGIRVTKGVSATNSGYDGVSVTDCSAIDCVGVGEYISGSATNKIKYATLRGMRSIRCASTVANMYLENIADGTLMGCLSAEPSTPAAFLYRIRDCDNMSIVGNRARHADAATGAAYYVDASAAGSSRNLTFTGNGAVFNSPASARGILVGNNALNISADASNDFSQANTPFSMGTGTGHRGGPAYGSATYDPASLAAGAGVSTTVTATGARLGDLAHAAFSLDLQGVTLTAYVSASNVVTVRFYNGTGAAVDLASGTLRVMTFKI